MCEVEVLEANPSAEVAIPVQPDFVILDSDLTSGTRQLERICSVSSSRQIIALVSSNDTGDQIRSKGIGIVDKRQGLTALVETVRSSLAIEIPGEDRILVVDDEEATLYMVSEFLKSRKYSVKTAQDGQSALNVLDRDPSVRVVLLDVIMPKMGGMETLKKAVSRTPHPTMIMMTVVSDQQIARQAVTLGAFDYILKPLDLKALEAIVSAGVSHFDYRRRSIWKNLFENS
jgi:DNA-binding response OmpR family regulator